MSYLLDTNILAVYTSKKPERAVLEWLDSVELPREKWSGDRNFLRH